MSFIVFSHLCLVTWEGIWEVLLTPISQVRKLRLREAIPKVTPLGYHTGAGTILQYLFIRPLLSTAPIVHFQERPGMGIQSCAHLQPAGHPGVRVEPDHALSPPAWDSLGCWETGIHVLFQPGWRQGRSVLLWVAQKGLLDRAGSVGICKAEMLLQSRCLMPGSSFPIIRETPGDEKAQVPTPPSEGHLLARGLECLARKYHLRGFSGRCYCCVREQSCAPEPGIHELLERRAHALMASLGICPGALRG